jgi:hypothetical protein
VEHQNKQDQLLSILQEHILEMEHTLTHDIRLMTPENTLEPEILVKWSIRDESAKNHEHLSITSENAKERSLREDQAHDPLVKGALKLALTSIS